MSVGFYIRIATFMSFAQPFDKHRSAENHDADRQRIFQNVPIRYEPALRVVFVSCSIEMVGSIKIVL